MRVGREHFVKQPQRILVGTALRQLLRAPEGALQLHG